MARSTVEGAIVTTQKTAEPLATALKNMAMTL